MVRRLLCAMFWALLVVFWGSSASWATTEPPEPSPSLSPSSPASSTEAPSSETPTPLTEEPSPEPVEPSPQFTTTETGVTEVTLTNEQFMPLLLACGFGVACLASLVVLMIGAHGD